MTTIRTTCNRCGDVELTTADISLELSSETSNGTYRFSCPFCGVVRHAAVVRGEEEDAPVASFCGVVRDGAAVAALHDGFGLGEQAEEVSA